MRGGNEQKLLDTKYLGSKRACEPSTPVQRTSNQSTGARGNYANRNLKLAQFQSPDSNEYRGDYFFTLSLRLQVSINDGFSTMHLWTCHGTSDQSQRLH